MTIKYVTSLIVMLVWSFGWFTVLHWYCETNVVTALMHSLGMFVFMFVVFEIIRS